MTVYRSRPRNERTHCPGRRAKDHRPGVMVYVLVPPLLLLLSAIIGIGPDFASGQETTVTGLVGESVRLPCDVDVKRCGNVYFITWTKNVSDVWKRIYLYSNDVEKPLQELANPDRADFFLRNSTAQLEIFPLRLADEGQYKCDVTYVRGKCPSLSYANLITLAKPSVPVIEMQGQALESGATVGPLQEGDVLSLTCKTFGGKPIPKVAWYKGDLQLSATVDESRGERGAGDVASTFATPLSRQDLGSRFECTATNEALEQPIRSWVELDLHVKPLEIEMESPSMPAKAGTALQVRCVISGARPVAEVVWYNRTTRMSHQPQPAVEPLGDGTFRTVSTLEVVLTRHDHEGSFSCKGSNPVLDASGEPPLERTVDLLVLYPPEVKIEQSRVGVVKEGGHVVLHCSYTANPRMILDMRWFKDDAPLRFDQDDRLEPSNPGLPTLTIRQLTRRDRGRYSCGLRNDIGWGNSTNIAHLDILYVPTVAAVVSPPFLEEGPGTRVTLSCNVLEGNPGQLRRVRWHRDGELLNESTERVVVWADVMRNATGNYSCQGENDAGWGPVSDTQELAVYYPPGPASVVHASEYAVKGKTTTLSCVVEDPGLPPATHYRWEFEGELIATATEAELVTPPGSLTSRGRYSCAAVNDVGAGPSGDYELPVLAPPSFIDHLPGVHGALQNSTDVSLSCRVECEPACVIEWLRAGESIDYSPQFSIQSTPHPEEPADNRFASVVSTLKFDMTQWPGGVLDRNLDNTTFTCRSSGNLVGRAVSSTTHFEVEYPPEDIEVSEKHLLVDEGNVAEEITCTANSKPPSEYMWMYNDQVISDSPLLFMNYSLGRERSGNYTCVASNRHGSTSANTYIDVIYPPSCVLYTSKNSEGQVTLICEVDANPAQVNITWMLGNETIERNVYSEGLRSIYTVPDSTAPEYYGLYLCQPNNSLGGAECEYRVNGPGDAYNHVYLDDEQVMMITGIAGLIVLIFIIIIVVLVLIMKRKRRRAGPKEAIEDRQTPEGRLSLSEDLSIHKADFHPPYLQNGSTTDITGNSVIAFKRVDEARRKRRTVSDLNSPVKAKSKAGAEPVYQNVEDKTENGPPSMANNEPENRATYENMPFHPQRNSKGCPSTASTVTSESTVTTSASDAPSLGSCKGLKPTSSSTATPPPCQRDERRQPTHYVNVMAPARAFPDPVHASINGVGLPPPRPKSTKPGSHVSTPVGSLGRRSATPMRTESRNGYRNGADGVPGYGLPSSRAHSPMMMQQQYHHYPRAALRDEDASDGGDLPLSSTPKVQLLRTNHREGVVYADLALLNNSHKAAVLSSRREGGPTEYATLKFHQTLDNAAAALQARYQ
ncbi:hemicentin-2 isoform X1 [Rhipicephalus microplus]|uniref:hemicentin-2 isoform X1 n=1 Tax=Rhipicephalus microplus TaxID=6941 RepID=UPI003F6BD407